MNTSAEERSEIEFRLGALMGDGESHRSRLPGPRSTDRFLRMHERMSPARAVASLNHPPEPAV